LIRLRCKPQDAAAMPLPRAIWLLPLLCLLAACGGGRTQLSYDPSGRTYAEPGPPGDPWGPYIGEASARFSVPQQWIRAVIHQESGGHEYLNGQPITSGAGAMGLMQLMPATYADLQSQYRLGSDPYDPHDNIMAGTAYISQMFAKYGAPAFLAAYNAGPQRLDDYLNSGRQLPNETINYVASIAPNLGTEIAMTGPLAAYAGGGLTQYDAPPAPPPVSSPVQSAYRLASYRQAAPARRSGASCWHDPDAAYDPDAPCQTPPRPVSAPAQEAPLVQTAMAYGEGIAAPQPSVAPAAPLVPVTAYGGGAVCWRDPDASYDAPCGARPAGGSVAPRFPGRPVPRPAIIEARAVAARPSAAVGDWMVQVGAFNNVGQARFATTMARQAAFDELAGAQSVVQQTVPFGGNILYRARLAGLPRSGAGAACSHLRAQNIPCMVVAPGG